jgi:tRNA A37 threonylcarbamoyladenosine synthetase subunit TsaC/SUA5/YrdC
VPDNRVAQCLLESLGEPLMSSTLLLPGDPNPLTDAEEVRDRLEKHVDAIIDGGACGLEPTSILDFSHDDVRVLRKGKGDVSAFER